MGAAPVVTGPFFHTVAPETGIAVARFDFDRLTTFTGLVVTFRFVSVIVVETPAACVRVHVVWVFGWLRMTASTVTLPFVPFTVGATMKPSPRQ
jgi:hypothetical protein